MLVIAKRSLRQFWEKHPDAEAPLSVWFGLASRPNFADSSDIKEQWGSASFVADNRVIFNIAGNKYRLVVHVSYEKRAIFIKFIGTHAEYDRIHPATVGPA